jgi:hypothetical protein
MTEKFEDLPQGGFITPQQKATEVVPLDAYAVKPPFATYIDRVFRRRKVKSEAEHARFMSALLNSKGNNDIVIFDRAREILREMREPYKWLFSYYEIRKVIIADINWLKMRWAVFRRNVGF